ncbi:MAG: hypothetical protein ACREIA_06570 [Opitutaceae bacterium]
MTVFESIVKELQELPTAKQVAVARYVHQLSEAAQQQRWDALGRLHGSLSEEDAAAFEEALRGARRLPAHG